MKRRESNYDLLRILSTLAVVIIHVCASYITIFGFQNRKIVFITYLMDSLSRFAVPCFLMLSGAFLLEEERNQDYNYFYRKAFKNFGVPTLVFSGIYFFYSVGKVLFQICFFSAPLNGLLEPVKNLIKGWPFYHMWYLYMLIGVYLLVPFIIKFKKEIGEKKFAIVSYVFLLFSMASVFTSTHKLYWDIGNAFCYCSYLMVGYSIRKKVSSKYSNGFGLFKIIVGEFLLLLPAILKMLQKYKKVFLSYKVFSPFCPIVVVASLLIFSGFSSLKIKKDFKKLASSTFFIFLLHAGIWDVLFLIIKRFSFFSHVIFIPLFSVLVFLLSWLGSFFLKKLFKKSLNIL